MVERFTVTKSDQPLAGGETSAYGATQNAGKSDKSEDKVPLHVTGEEEEVTIQVTDGSSNKHENLYLYSDDFGERPAVQSVLKTIQSYSATVPAAPSDPDAKPVPTRGAELGTLMGVYLPCIQNIFGVILFVRMTWIVGTAGWIQGFLVVFMCCCVTLLTSISMSAVATNGVVPAGGSYYMISRALGPEFGGAVGILFYMGTTVAGSMYIIGAVEIVLLYIAPVMSLFGDITTDENLKFHNFRIYGTVLLLFIALIISVGVKFVNKFASVALVCVIVSIVAIYVGIFVKVSGDNSLVMCTLGPRLLVQAAGPVNCTREYYEQFFCHMENGTNEETQLPEMRQICDDYFNEHNFTTILSIPGMASGVMGTNVEQSYVDKGSFLTTSDDPVDNQNLLSETAGFFVQADTTTSFITLVGIFFPSVTGIMAGSNRSGDLKDAQKSIPVGTICAILTTGTVYLSSVILFGASIDNLMLRDKFGDSVGGRLVIANLAWPSEWVILIGSLLSTIGAGMQSLTGAPRLLQAIAKDEIIPFLRPLAVSAANGEPRRALVCTWFICQISVLIGNLDDITPLLSCFFLMCYGFVNLACALQTVLRSPNWRPRFKYYHWTLSMSGVSLCFAVMFMCSWYYALASIGMAVMLYKYIEYRGAEKEWGDGIRGLALSAARYALLRLEEGPPHTKNWRPQILILSKLSADLVPKEPRLMTFAAQLKAGKGLTMAVSVIEGSYAKKYSEAQAAKISLRKIMNQEKVKGFVECLVTDSVSSGVSCLVQTSGIGGMKPNTVIVGWPTNWKKAEGPERPWEVFINTIRTVQSAKMALLVPKGIRYFPDSQDKITGNIDIWWIVHDGGLLMLLPFLLKQHKTWKACRMRIFTVAQLEDNSIQMKKDLKNFLYQLRIDADVEVVELHDSDISEYTYERTLMMEQRSQMLSELKLSRRRSKQLVQNILDKNRAPEGSPPKATVQFNIESAEEVEASIRKQNSVDSAGSGKPTPPGSQRGSPEKKARESPPIFSSPSSDSSQPNSPVVKPGTVPPGFRNLLDIRPSDQNIRRMHTAVRLNEVIVSRSHDAKLVVLNLPGPQKNPSSDSNYMEFLEVLTEGLERVLMVRGGGREVITIYS
ncbi:unnamed protein product [Cyprideis torosa]|uniref:Uncharacterized protein n=1 Tax=Cyprideis torosa TaxID=163714 RepID=A0A7R8W7P5_9CRUS|nr:unnamed protein product [Cyprideis torosa]CAG0882391.1 unnamed protein product [Cyprideis torosa]